MKFKIRRVGIFQTILLLLCLVDTGVTQPDIEWINNYGGTENEIGYKVTQTSDGGYIVAGSSNSNDIDVSENNGGDDWWIVKTDDQGDIEWQKVIGNERVHTAYDIIETVDNEFIIAGTFNDTISIDHDFTLVKLDSDGELIWQKFYGDFTNQRLHAISLTADGGYILAGNSGSLGGLTEGDGLFMKIDSVGDLEWEKTYGGDLSDEIFSVQQTSDLGYVAVGRSNSDDGTIGIKGNDTWVLKMDAAGDLEWSNTYGGSDEDEGWSIQQADDGGYLIAGSSRSSDGDVENNYGNQDVWLFKLDQNGLLIWEKTFGGTKQDIARAIQKVSAGGFVISGWTRSNGNDVSQSIGIDIWVFQIDNNGTLEWEKTFGGSGIDQCLDIKETSDGGFVATGNTYSTNGDFNENYGNSDLWIMKLAPLSVGINETKEEYIINVFPNPNSGQFSIKMSNVSGPAAVKVYGQQGKIFYSNDNVDLTKIISVDFLSKGLYILEVTTKGKTFTRKFIIN